MYETLSLIATMVIDFINVTAPPFGQLPMLEVNKDLTICQANAIDFYVGKTYGLLYLTTMFIVVCIRKYIIN